MAMIFDHTVVDRDLYLAEIIACATPGTAEGYVVLVRLLTGDVLFTTNACCEYHGARELEVNVKRMMAQFTPCGCDQH